MKFKDITTLTFSTTAGRQLILCGACTLLLSCISSPSLQTAHTLAPGQGQSYIGFNMYTSPSINKAVNKDTRFDQGDVRDYSILFGHKRGLDDNIDAGVRVSLFGSAGFDVKYRFLHTASVNLATGFDLNYASISTGDGDAKADINVIDYTLPLWTSYDFSPETSIYAVPRYIMRKVTGDASGTLFLFGWTFGLKSTSATPVAFEVSQIQGHITQFSVAYFFF